MKVLFVDNFRGFNKTSIPIDDVNFFVGENSTGKTSILGLLRMIASNEFWFTFDFSMEDGIFGHFKDIISISANDKSYFAFGIMEKTEDVQEKPTEGHFCVFTEKDGMPRIAFYAYINGEQTITIRVTEKQAKYKVEDKFNNLNTLDNINTIFNEQLMAFKNDKTGYKSASKAGFGVQELIRMQSLGLMISIIKQQVIKQEKFTKNKSKSKRDTININRSQFYDFAWLAPIRTQPRRTYDEYKLDFSPEGMHTPYLIKKILEKKNEAEEFKVFLEKIGKDSGLFDSVKIKKYGKSATSPFELDIILNRNALSINNVGYGVSQSLPVIVEIFARDSGCWFAIQQPEVHLHPRAQAALGDMIFELAQKEDKKFIIETHSDYTIDRFRINYNRKRKSNLPKANIIYFERSLKGNNAYTINIDDNGNISDDQPKGYRKFFIKEDIKLLGL